MLSNVYQQAPMQKIGLNMLVQLPAWHFCGRSALEPAGASVSTPVLPVALLNLPVQDVWEFADLSDKEVLFKPEEIDEALACLTG